MSGSSRSRPPTRRRPRRWLETTLEGAHSILLSITGGKDLSLWEVNEAAHTIQEAAHPDANIIFGAMLDEKFEDEVWITVVATGYGERRPAARGALAVPGADRRAGVARRVGAAILAGRRRRARVHSPILRSRCPAASSRPGTR